ncbi:MAG: hypothetical protein K9K65_18005 [Desulfarculaceae bacterium]|nr:hypothetical protein [Desulfarculaceae bacterium]MCF8124365.1 hypothetical protein [Desulfarculaceae bacterium]
MSEDMQKRLENVKSDAAANAEMLAALKEGLVNKGFSSEEALAVAKAAAAAACTNGHCGKY